MGPPDQSVNILFRSTTELANTLPKDIADATLRYCTIARSILSEKIGQKARTVALSRAEKQIMAYFDGECSDPLFRQRASLFAGLVKAVSAQCAKKSQIECGKTIYGQLQHNNMEFDFRGQEKEYLRTTSREYARQREMNEEEVKEFRELGYCLADEMSAREEMSSSIQ